MYDSEGDTFLQGFSLPYFSLKVGEEAEEEEEEPDDTMYDVEVDEVEGDAREGSHVFGS